VAPPYTLKYLKTFGFKTFDRWWDESYDNETNHHKRITKIFDIIDYINSKSIDELTIIYSEMTNILEHNQAIIKTIPFNDKIL
jgi:F0F1-type ATP synthase gamma subunit